MDKLIPILQYCAISLTAVTAFFLIKKSLITTTATITRNTDSGEQITINTQFSAFDSDKAVKAKIDRIFEKTDARKAFVHERMEELLRNEVAENEAAAKTKTA